MKKQLQLLILGFTTLAFLGNMAEPVERTSLFGRPFTAQQVDITHEEIRVKLDESFQTARFEITYFLQANREGIRIPLLFYAIALRDGFEVALDGKPLQTKEIPPEYSFADSASFREFFYLFHPDSSQYEENRAYLLDGWGTGYFGSVNDLVYFEADISKGKHEVTVNYTADPWIDSWDWMNEYSFHYALAPAKHWKSFGTLEIILDATAFPDSISTNLGPPLLGRLDSVARWQFDAIPEDVLEVHYQQEMPKTAIFLIRLGPRNLAFIAGAILLILHLWVIRAYRRRNPSVRYSWVVILGGILLPFLFLWIWMMAYPFIDWFIGEHAAAMHEYIFFILFLYPVIMPVYLGLMWLWDYFWKRKFILKTK
jgi:hypothetical protein